MVIEICETNEAREWIPRIKELYPEADVVVYPCMNRCNACFLTLFVLLDGELVEAYSPEQLLEKMRTI